LAPRGEIITSLPLKKCLFSFIIGMIVLLGSISLVDAGHGGSDVSKVYHTPEHPRLNDSVEVVIKLHNISDILSVQIFVCSMEPVFCFYADNMDNKGNNTFESIIEYQHLDFKSGTVLGYNFKIKYSDNSTKKFPNSLILDDHDNILEVSEGVYYFTFTIGGNNEMRNNKDNIVSMITIFIMTSIISLVIIIMLIALFMKKSKNINKRQQSKKVENNDKNPSITINSDGEV
jgi:hypothetical protein